MLLLELFDEMVAETSEIMKSIPSQNLFHGILDAPKAPFKISMKYLFFYVDYVEIRRSYKDIYQKAEKGNTFRKKNYLKILQLLQTQKILRKELTKDALNYLMDLSGAMRTFFFLNLHPDNFSDKNLEKKYIIYVNNLIMPYLTSKELKEFSGYLK
jgi:hypothetical protein